ncbi:MAG: hypothetical protein LBI10_02400 [Deltaproteobacteria bacterium]|jgi:hypothetical protein|nr:hypothetical protein [Deltaproteobacteria bacterium]
MYFFKYLVPLGLAALVLTAVNSLAQPVSSEAIAALDKAKAAHSIGDNKTALEAIWVAQAAIWNAAPLGVKNVAFVTEQPENFGSYKPKNGIDFQSHEPIIFYSEPFGFTQRQESDGTYSYSINGAFAILDSQNKLLGRQDNLGPYEMRGYRTFSVENMLAMTIGVQGLPAGSYVLRVTLTDNLNPSKTTSVDQPFRLVGGE